jgi:hypothetical protein
MTISSIWAFFQGKRTYIISALIYVLGGCKALGWVDSTAYEAILAILLGSGLASLRAAK